MSGATLDELLATPHANPTRAQRDQVRRLLAGQTDGAMLVAMLGLDTPESAPLPVRERPQHYHGATLPKGRAIGHMS